MTHRLTLKVTSVLCALLFSLHWADEVARGIEPGTVSAYGGIFILFVWLYAALVLVERRSGLVILLLASILGSGVPVLHMQGVGLIGGRIAANSSGALFWVWTNVAMGAVGLVAFALAARGLWSFRKGPAA